MNQHDARHGTTTVATHARPDASDTHGGHDKHAGHDPEVFRRRFWLSLLVDDPGRRHERDGHGLVRLRTRFPGRVVGRTGARLVRVLLGWLAVPQRSRGRRSATRQPGMMLLIAMAITVAYASSMATSLGLVRSRVLVGAGGAGDDHVARATGRR